jgi:hypothetical protein
MFSNSTEWEIWSYNWCRTCLNDENEDCDIILNLMVNGKDARIRRDGPNLSDIICDGYDPKITVN